MTNKEDWATKRKRKKNTNWILTPVNNGKHTTYGMPPLHRNQHHTNMSNWIYCHVGWLYVKRKGKKKKSAHLTKAEKNIKKIDSSIITNCGIITSHCQFYHLMKTVSHPCRLKHAASQLCLEIGLLHLNVFGNAMGHVFELHSYIEEEKIR